MLRKMGMNVVFLCVASLLAVGAVNCPPLAGAQGVESQGLALDPDRGVASLSVPSADQGGIDSYVKLLLHADGSDQGTAFTDSSSSAKTVTNTESYDSYTKLMLHMEGSGNSFTDSAASKAVTTNGDVTQTTAQYKFGSKSGAFDGTNDYLTIPDSNDWDFGTGDFTIDLWFYKNDTTNNNEGLISSKDVDDGNGWQIYIGSNTITFISNSTIPATQVYAFIPTLEWVHIAVVRYLGIIKLYVNGVAQSTFDATGVSIDNLNNLPLGIGKTFADYDYYLFNGWIDEVRVSKGIARWTSDFTPPSSPYGKVYTVTGTKKFGTASGLFDGSGSYLSLADSADWDFGTGDFTIDMWINPNVWSGASYDILYSQHVGGSDYVSFYREATTNKLIFHSFSGGTSRANYITTSAPSISTGSWYHIALVRNGSNVYVFVNGVSPALTTNTAIGTMPNIAESLCIGANQPTSSTHFFDGWIDEFRVSKGIARWTSNFTPPTAPYETDTTSPTVSSTSPASSSTGVGVSTAISATFSEDMDSSTITTSTFTLSSSSSSGSSGSSIRQAQDRSVGWVKRSAPNETGDDEDGFWKANPPPDPLQRGTTDGFASLNPSYTKNAFTPTSSSVSGTVSYSNKVATFTPSSNLSYSTTYTATITTGVKDVSGNAMSSTYTWSFTTGSAPDTTAPSGSITINSGASYTNSTAVTLSLSATDSVGVVGYYASTSSSTPVASASGWNSVTSTTSYTGSVSYTLTSGDEQKTVYVWFKDSTGNISNSANDSITLDTTAPIVTITSPTSNDTYTATSSILTLEGSASDSTSGVKEVTWSSDKGSSGTASGTTYWSISSVSLSTGNNKITVTAKDNAGNTSTDTITMTYSAATKPTITTGSTSNVTATSATLTGTVNANGLSTTAWFEYGTVQGTYGSKSSTKTVTGSNDTTVSITITGLTAETTYYYRAAAQNNSGTSYGSEMTFIYSAQCSMPTVTTESATDVTSTTATLNGTVNANSFSTTAWFEYGKQSGVYGSKSDTKSVSGSTDTKVSISVKNLTSGTTYYFRIVAQNCGGTTYGTEMEFYKSPGTDTTPTPFPTLPPLPNPTQIIIPTPPQTGECSWDGSISIQSIDPPEGTVLDVGETYTFTINVKYEFTTATSGNIGVNAQDMDIFMNLDNQFQNGVSVYSRSGEETISVTTNISLNGNPVNAVEVYVSLFPEGYNCSYVNDSVQYKTDAASATPTPLSTLTPLPTPVPEGGIVFGFVNDLDENPLKGVTVTITKKGFSMVTSGDRYNKGRLVSAKSTLSESTETDEDGYYEFSGLSAGEYAITYEKEGYGTQTHDITFEEGELKELETVLLEKIEKSRIYGYAVNIKGDPIEFVRLKLKGIKTKVTKSASTDADGFFEFADLEADTYVIVAKKKKYRNTRQKVVLEEGESTEIEIVMKKTSKRINELLLEEDIQ